MLMVLGVSMLSIMDSCVKWVLNQQINVVEIIALRGILILIILLLLLPARGGWKAIKTTRIKLHLWRASIGFLAPLCFFSSLKYIPIADATAIFFCTTFFMTAGSAIFLKEPVGWHRWLAVLIGFIGVLLVVSPGTQNFHPAAILPLIAGMSYAAILLIGRVLTSTDEPFKLVFYFTLFNAVLFTALLPFFWTTPSLNIVYVLIAISGFAITGYFCLSTAILIVPISILAPFEYASLIWAVLLGYWFWGETPNSLAWLGIALILGAGLYIIKRERKAIENHPSS